MKLPRPSPKLVRFSKNGLLFLGAFALLELALKIAETRLGLHYFNRLRTHWYESFHFYHGGSGGSYGSPPPQAPPRNYDPLLGWRNFPPGDPQNSSGMTINSEGWRSTREYQAGPSPKPRVLLFGDSFVFGNGVADNEHTAFYLQEALGDTAEVLNFSVRGYGLDQMTLLASLTAPVFHGDWVILAFIGADLQRSCQRFFLHARKPWFGAKANSPAGSTLQLRGVPVETPRQTWDRHQTLASRIEDTAKTWLLRSRLVVLGGEAFLFSSQEKCRSELNARLLETYVPELAKTHRVILAHLDQDLPSSFARALGRLPATNISFPAAAEALSKRWNKPVTRFADRHPKPETHFLQAVLLREALGEVVANSRRDFYK